MFEWQEHIPPVRLPNNVLLFGSGTLFSGQKLQNPSSSPRLIRDSMRFEKVRLFNTGNPWNNYCKTGEQSSC